MIQSIDKIVLDIILLKYLYKWEQVSIVASTANTYKQVNWVELSPPITSQILIFIIFQDIA